MKGFTVVELLVVMGIAAILLGFSTINLVKVQRNTTTGAALDSLMADLRSQQAKAMSGAEGGGNFGIFFNSTNSYILFKGSSYNPSDANNFTVALDEPISVSSIFPNDPDDPGQIVVFTQGNGEIVGFSNTSNKITVTNTAGSEGKTLNLNRLGVITSVD